MSESSSKKLVVPINTFRIVQVIISILFFVFVGWRFYTVIREGVYGPDTCGLRSAD